MSNATLLSAGLISLHPALFGLIVFAIAFEGLLLLTFFARLVSYRKKAKAKGEIQNAAESLEQKSAKGGNAADGSAFQAAPGRSGELVLVKVAERDAALIMAIVADELKIPINELDFKSIKRVEENL